MVAVLHGAEFSSSSTNLVRIKPALKKKTLGGHRDFYLKVAVTMEGGSSFPKDELQLNFTDQQIQPSQVYLQMIPICNTDASLDSVIIHSFKMT